ncbi:DUF5682 family protein [Halostreptopolyspora alba]|uniref:Uncharacterized protein n=1 Tax=Halostreptopolyspora alba TaxID=2487137 RepID=A0A3N0E7U9_9ACTN|nr:hypothetical protein EFW17_13695 [Nocardiopsaceae bacterium YIM 96095]
MAVTTARAGSGAAGSDVHVLGIRHHGPGSARAVLTALEELEPDAVLIEGPPEADTLTGLVGAVEPPVALLAYHPDDPATSAFWPLATFSPEWQALRYAHDHDTAVRFCDLPAGVTLAERRADHTPGTEDENGQPEAPEDPADRAARRARLDPLAVLAEAAGYDDAERWWDDVVEQRDDGEPSPFPAITEAMAAVRTELAPEPDEREARREAHMRQTIRAALKEGYERLAVICGAWHAPALSDPKTNAHAKTATADRALLRGLSKVKTNVTWVPWTHGRLSTASGYRAGVTAPGWYHHLFTAPDRPIHRWLTDTARVLRDEDQPVSSAHVIEAVRLAETLATVRGRPLAGLSEVAEATSAVLCEGEESRAQLAHRRMVVGERLGAVPEDTPMVPLQRDLAATQRALRFKPEALSKRITLDLRTERQRDRSVLLHRLRLIGVNWGVPARDQVRSRGTFRESWQVQWAPELDVAVIEASRWGTTVAGAATARARDLAASAELPTLTDLTERCLLAELTDALPEVLDAVARRAAADRDVTHLMGALPPLARSSRYGDVRGTDAEALRTVADELLRRVCSGLAPAVANLDDDAATTMTGLVDAVHTAAHLLGADAERRWLDTLDTLAAREVVPGLVAGRAHRILHDSGRVDSATVRRRLGLAVSRAGDPAHAAAWLEGFLSGSGMILAHDHELLAVVDTWLTGLSDGAFTAVLPLLRRTFGAFASPERRSIGEVVARPRPAEDTGQPHTGPGIDTRRAAPAMTTVAAIIGG